MTIERILGRDGLSEVRQFAVSPPDRPDGAVSPDLVELLAQCAQMSRSPMLLTDAELDTPGPTVLWVNHAFEEMTGYDADQIVGRNPRLLQGPATDRSVLDRLRASLEAGLDFEGEAINYRIDGTPFVMSWRITALEDADGNITHYLATQDDVTSLRLRPLQNRHAVLTLQASLAPSVPRSVGRYQLDSAYRPADGQLLGGDWVDVIDTPDDRTVFVVGDVTGHGSEAVAVMGQLRWSTRAAAMAGLSLSDINRTLRRVATSEDAYATVLLVALDDTGEFEYLCAGHPPAMIVSGGDVVRELPTTTPLIGLGVEVRDETGRGRLEPGECLIAYTDGLIERRSRELDEGFELLREELRALAASGRPPAEWARVLVASLVADGGGEDDVAVLTVCSPDEG